MLQDLAKTIYKLLRDFASKRGTTEKKLEKGISRLVLKGQPTLVSFVCQFHQK